MRFNLLGGPGVGKSTKAAEIFAFLKRRGESIELIPEYVKTWVYLNRLPQKFDQIYLFGKQLHSEDKVMRSGVKNLVSDSPIYLGHIYARMFSGIDGLSEHLLGLANLYDQMYPSVSIYLQRDNKPFMAEGRWGDEMGARVIDAEVYKFVQERHKDAPETLLVTNYDNHQAIYDFVLKHLSK